MSCVYWLGYTLFKLGARLFYSYQVIHAKRLIERGPALIVSNHTSFLDPPMIGIAFDNAIHYLARKTLFDNPVGGWIIRRCNAVPVNQERADVTSLKTILRHLKAGERVLVFPEGHRTFDGRLAAGEPGVGWLVAKSGVPVLPMRLFGTHEALPRGAKWFHPSRITVVVGNAIDFSKEDLAARGKENYQKLSDRIMEEIGKLELPEEERR